MRRRRRGPLPEPRRERDQALDARTAQKKTGPRETRGPVVL
jgi:hypothetical protein